MLRILVVTAALTAATAPAARAETHYGGAGIRNGAPAVPSISIVHRDDGTVIGRIAAGHVCPNHFIGTMVIRVRGRVNGQAFSLSGSTRLRTGRVRATLTGTLTPDTATGRVRVRGRRGCDAYARGFVVRAASAPAGPPAVPARNSTLHGLTSQSASGMRLPVSVRVARNGRVVVWTQAMLKCRRSSVPMLDGTSPISIKADGTFSRTHRYVIRYSDAPDEHYRVTVRGRFLADGAVGTVSARMVWRERGARYYPCRSGTRTWAAR
jgi:hypothetical protein